MGIERFDGEYFFLSNFHPSAVRTAGIVWPTAEHAYQAAKTADVNCRAALQVASSPGAAKRIGRLAVLRPDWEDIKKRVMLQVVLLKFVQNPALAAALAATGDQPLTEGNHWHDNYWGSCSCPRCSALPGLNYLGRLLMSVRDVVRAD